MNKKMLCMAVGFSVAVGSVTPCRAFFACFAPRPPVSLPKNPVPFVAPTPPIPAVIPVVIQSKWGKMAGYYSGALTHLNNHKLAYGAGFGALVLGGGALLWMMHKNAEIAALTSQLGERAAQLNLMAKLHREEKKLAQDAVDFLEQKILTERDNYIRDLQSKLLEIAQFKNDSIVYQNIIIRSNKIDQKNQDNITQLAVVNEELGRRIRQLESNIAYLKIDKNNLLQEKEVQKVWLLWFNGQVLQLKEQLNNLMTTLQNSTVSPNWQLQNTLVQFKKKITELNGNLKTLVQKNKSLRKKLYNPRKKNREG